MHEPMNVKSSLPYLLNRASGLYSAPDY